MSRNGKNDMGPNEDNNLPPVILFDGFCSVTRSYLANLLVEENFHFLFLLAVLWSLMKRHLFSTVIESK
jgi:hypothetical protein